MTTDPFTSSVVVDDQQLPATQPYYIETAERIGPVLDVQAVQSGALDSGPLIHVGDAALSPSGATALRDHLDELLGALT